MRTRTEQAIELMMGFAKRTGLTGACPQQRYLWTDAFAVCNFLGLARLTGEARFTELALQLVDRVHHDLGRHRADDRRTGWISGLAESEGEAHPTRGGLRIGKPLPERRRGEPLDERLEWDRDGQYFHYLTKWMHALDQVARATGETMFHLWARELAHAAHRAFTYVPRHGAGKRMYWKTKRRSGTPAGRVDGPTRSARWSRHVHAARGDGRLEPGPPLDDAIADFGAMIDPRSLATRTRSASAACSSTHAGWSQLEQTEQAAGGWSRRCSPPPSRVSGTTSSSRTCACPRRRLAFRELGLAIGLAAIEADVWRGANPGVRAGVDRLSRYLPLRAEIEAFWLQPEHRREGGWVEHASINEVMLATSLHPEGFLVLAPVRAS